MTINFQSAGSAVQCSSVQCSAVQCSGPGVISCCSVLWQGRVRGVALHCTALHCTALHCTALPTPLTNMCRENEFQPKFTQRGVTSAVCSVHCTALHCTHCTALRTLHIHTVPTMHMLVGKGEGTLASISHKVPGNAISPDIHRYRSKLGWLRIGWKIYQPHTVG
jgi:hypothetical protein